nr:PREDICTED: endothelin-converting enzyme 1-like [Bemisia tabaci]
MPPDGSAVFDGILLKAINDSQSGSAAVDRMPAGVENSTSNQHLVEVSTKATWLKKNSTVLDRRLVCILGTVCFLLCLGLVLICYQYITVVTSECTSEICIRSAANLLQSMDQSVDPCEDFYGFACGRWAEEHPTPDAAFSHDWFNERRTRIEHSIREYLERNDSDSEPAAVHQARTMFRACMNAEAIEELKFAPIEDVMEDIGLSLLPPANNTKFGWGQVSVNAKLGLNRDLFLQVSVGPDPFNHTINRISINRPEANSPLPSHKDLEKRMRRRMAEEVSLEEEGIVSDGVKAYYNYVISVIKLFHDYKNKTITTQEIIDEYVNSIREANILINEIHQLIENKTDTDPEPEVYTLGQLQKLTNSFSETGKQLRETYTLCHLISPQLIENKTDTDPEPEVYTLGQLQKLTNSFSETGKQLIDWRWYFNLMFENVENVTLDLEDDDIILVYNVDYFEGLIKVLERTAPQTVEFMFWLDIVQLLAPHSTKELRRLNQDFIEALTGIQTIKTRFFRYGSNQLTCLYLAQIDWRWYFNLMFENVENVTLDLEDDDIILVYNVDYFEGLIKVLERTAPQTVEFMFWLDIVQLLAPHSTKELRRLNQDFIEALTGIQTIKTRELQCTESVIQLMGMAVSYSILNEENLRTTKERVEEMINNIRWAFEKLIERLDWMDKPTKSATLEKVEAMRSFIGYPEWLAEPRQLEEYYSGLGVAEDTYLDNVRNMTRLLVNNMLFSLDTPNDFQSVWAVDPIDVNAFHTFQANAITIPMGILQYPFYNLGLEALNYGAIGSILGHELTHGFDDTGRKYDKTGNKLPWWTNKTINEYMNKTECFVEQYSSYYLPEINQSINGAQTLDENIADNGGLREALWAYRHYVRNHGQERTLPGLGDYNHEQLLFLSFANLWCESWTTTSLKWDMKDVHCPNRIRVAGVLSNSPEFSTIWGCPKGAKMNPKKRKCQLW